MDVKKIKIGIAVDKDVLEKLDKIANASAYLDTSRSEIINVILRAFFKSNPWL